MGPSSQTMSNVNSGDQINKHLEPPKTTNMMIVPDSDHSQQQQDIEKNIDKEEDTGGIE